jgi:hypothetical protein
MEPFCWFSGPRSIFERIRNIDTSRDIDPAGGGIEEFGKIIDAEPAKLNLSWGVNLDVAAGNLNNR